MGMMEAPQFIFDSDFERKFVDCLYIQHLVSETDLDDGRRKRSFCK